MIRAFGKLPVMRIWLVTIHAFLEDKRLLKVAAGMALGAIHADVLPNQRKLRLRMVKAFIDRAQRYLLPARGAVAGLATLQETPPVRILVAIGTLVERNSRITRPIVHTLRMALGARHLSVQTGQRIARLRVIELTDADCFPVFKVVALLTGLPEPSVVRVLVAGSAGGRQA